MAGRTHRKITGFAITFVVLLALLVAADRIGVVVAEHITASQLKKAQHLSTEPSVDIAGVPFLTQLASDHYDKVTVDADDVPLGRKAHGALLQHLHAVLNDVRTSRNFHHVQAGRLTASGSTNFVQLSKALDQGTLRYAGNGRVALTKSKTVLGQRLSITVSSLPTIDDNGELSFHETRIDNAGSLLEQVSQDLTSLFDLKVQIDEVPFGLVPTAIAVSTTGVTFTLSGSDVDLTQQQQN